MLLGMRAIITEMKYQSAKNKQREHPKVLDR